MISKHTGYVRVVTACESLSIESRYVCRITKKAEASEWEDFFAGLDGRIGHVPALHELRVLACEWPTTECVLRISQRGVFKRFWADAMNRHGITKSLWVKWAETLLERGIKLVNKTGVEWHPRLRAARR